MKRFSFYTIAVITLLLAGCASLSGNPTNVPASLVPVGSPTSILATSTVMLPVASPTATLIATAEYSDLRKSLSPGMYVVYWSQNTWYVKGVAESNVVNLIPNVTTGELNTDIRFSYDNNLVAFSQSVDEISIYDLRSGEMSTYVNPHPNNIHNFIYDFQWTHDDKTLIYLATQEEFPIPDAIAGVNGVSLPTGEIFAIIDREDDRFSYGIKGITLSSDGQWLAFYASRLSEMMAPDPQYAIYLMNATCLSQPKTCSESIRLIGDGTKPVWSPDGKLGWVCNSGSQSALCFEDINSTMQQPEVLLTTNGITISPNGSIVNFSWSPNGEYIALNLVKPSNTNVDEFTMEVMLIPMNGEAPIKITVTPDESESFEGWSPDSSYLVISQRFGFTEPYGDIGIISPLTDLYVYDVQNGKNIDLIDNTIYREVFGFFMSIR